MEHDGTLNILDLHEEFLLQIFRHCDFETQVHLSEVNKYFNEILHARIFWKIEVCKIFIDYDSDKVMWKIPKCIGQYVTKLDIDIWYKDDDFMKRYFQMVSMNVGSNVRELNMNRIRMTDELLEPLKPILKGLNTLKNWHFDRQCNRSIGDMQTICPNLFKLTLFKGIKFVDGTAWPNLTKLSMKYLPLRLKLFRDFVALNPQIVNLKITCKSERWVAAIAEHLPNLEKLTFFEAWGWNITVADLPMLKQLKRLTKLSLPSSCDELDAFLLYLGSFTKLRKLKLNDNLVRIGEDSDQYSFVKLAQMLTYLQVFHFPLCNLDKNIIIEFVRFAKCLKEIFIGYEYIAVNVNWINALGNARKSSQVKDGKPLTLLINPNDRNYNTIKDLVEESDFVQYLRVVPSFYYF